MKIIQLTVGKENYGSAKGVTVALLGVEVYASRTKGGVWMVGIYSDWNDWSFEKTFWKKK